MAATLVTPGSAAVSNGVSVAASVRSTVAPGVASGNQIGQRADQDRLRVGASAGRAFGGGNEVGDHRRRLLRFERGGIADLAEQVEVEEVEARIEAQRGQHLIGRGIGGGRAAAGLDHRLDQRRQRVDHARIRRSHQGHGIGQAGVGIDAADRDDGPGLVDVQGEIAGRRR